MANNMYDHSDSFTIGYDKSHGDDIAMIQISRNNCGVLYHICSIVGQDADDFYDCIITPTKWKNETRKKIFVIGSTSQEDKIKEVAELKMVFITLVTKAFDAIADADEIIVVPKPDRTFGEGTIYELEFAARLKKKIVLYFC